MAAVTICSDFGAPKNKVWHCFPIYLPWSDGTGCHDLSFWMLSFKTTFSLSSFTFIKRLSSSSSLSAIRVVSSVYVRLLIFLPAILTPACASSSLAFHMIYSSYGLNKQGDNIQPWQHSRPPAKWTNICRLCLIFPFQSLPPSTETYGRYKGNNLKVFFMRVPHPWPSGASWVLGLSAAPGNASRQSQMSCNWQIREVLCLDTSFHILRLLR